MMTRVKKMAAAAAFLGISAASIAGLARTTPGINFQIDSAVADCADVKSILGSVTNQCSTTQHFYFPATIESSGNKTVSVLAQGTTKGSNVCCMPYALDQWGGPHAGLEAAACLPSLGPVGTISLGSETNVPAYGTLFVDCTIDPGARVASVNLQNP